MMRLVALTSVLMVLSLWGWLPTAGAEDIERWLTDATAGSQEGRLQALQELGKSGDIRALPVLLQAAQESNQTIREHAIAALRNLIQTFQGVYRIVARWVEQFLATLDEVWTPRPAPDIEKTQRTYTI
jgi:hypothetical protein